MLHHKLSGMAVLVGLSAFVAGCASTGLTSGESMAGTARVAPVDEVSISRVKIEIVAGKTEISGQVRPLRNSRSIYLAHIDLRWEMPDGRVIEQSNVRFERISRSPNRNTRAWFRAELDPTPPPSASVHVIYHKDPHTPDLVTRNNS